MDIETSVAPCGVNCSVCYAHLRSKNKCGGCWGSDNLKPKHCIVCKIRNCEYLAKSGSNYCFVCEKYPCIRVKQLDKRYVAKYRISLKENLELVRVYGIHAFMEIETEKWTCKCGGVVCEHTGRCSVCNELKVPVF